MWCVPKSPEPTWDDTTLQSLRLDASFALLVPASQFDSISYSLHADATLHVSWALPTACKLRDMSPHAVRCYHSTWRGIIVVVFTSGASYVCHYFHICVPICEPICIFVLSVANFSTWFIYLSVLLWCVCVCVLICIFHLFTFFVSCMFLYHIFLFHKVFVKPKQNMFSHVCLRCIFLADGRSVGCIDGQQTVGRFAERGQSDGQTSVRFKGSCRLA